MALLADDRATAAKLGSVNALHVVELMCEDPIVTIRLVEARLGVARPTALRLLRQPLPATGRCSGWLRFSRT